MPELTAAEFAAALDAHARKEAQMNTQLDPALEPDRGPLQTLHSAGLQPDQEAGAGVSTDEPQVTAAELAAIRDDLLAGLPTPDTAEPADMAIWRAERERAQEAEAG